MRIAHITDIHVLVPPKLGQLFGKRLLGTTNLYLFGRHGHFSREVQESLSQAVARLDPDLLVCSGDLTAQGTPEEFEEFGRLFSDLFSRQPSVLIPGNHDTYTPRSCRERRIEDTMGHWTGSGPWPRLHKAPGVQLVCIDSCRAHFLSSGQVPSPQLERLDSLLASEKIDDTPLFVVLHYPLRGRRGDAYGPPARAIENASEVEAVLRAHGPRITAILHGHEHHGYRTQLPYEGGEIPIFNPGASGYAWLPDHGRTAHFNLYTLREGGVEVERYRWCGDSKAFEPEPGGAYATGG